MNNRALVLAVASCFALTGCPDKPEPPKPKPTAATPAPAPVPPAAKPRVDTVCNSNKCDATITVRSCEKEGITVAPPHLGIHKDKQHVKIHWTIRTNGYEFPKDKEGIFFKLAASAAPQTGQFKDPKRESDTEYSWKDRNENEIDIAHEYGVRVVDKNGKVCETDPTVVNGVVVENPVISGVAPPQPPPAQQEGDKK